MIAPTIEPNLIIRPFQRETDIPRLIQFAIDAENRQPEEADAIKVEIENSFTQEGHVPERDRFIAQTVEEPESLVAHASLSLQLQERVLASIVVHPVWRRRGIGSALLEYIRKRAHAYEASHIALGAKIDETAGHAFLQHHGFRIAGHIRTFVAPAEVPIPEPKWPAGFTVRPFEDVQSFAVLATAQNRCYHDMWGHVENTEGAITEEVLADYLPNHPEFFNAAGVHLVFAPDGEAIGVCYGRGGNEIQGNRQKIIDSPGIASEYRHLDLQRPLTLYVMHWLRQTYGSGPIELLTFGDTERAVEIYQELGFRLEPQNHYIDYRLDLK